MLEAEERARALSSIRRQSHERVARQLDIMTSVWGTDREVVAAIVDGAQEAVMGWLPKGKAPATTSMDPTGEETTTRPFQSKPQIGDVWTFRTRAVFVLPGTRGQEEREAIQTITTMLASDLPEALATIDILSLKRTPTGRYSAMVKRTRIALTEGDL